MNSVQYLHPRMGYRNVALKNCGPFFPELVSVLQVVVPEGTGWTRTMPNHCLSNKNCLLIYRVAYL